jgi:mannose/fructose-specific phosphotransferase system component IIA
MAAGIVDAVARISGVGREALVPVSNDGKAPEVLEAELAEFLGKGPVIFFTDLPSGSCAVAARVCCKRDSEAAVISGVNLPVLLDFVFHRDLALKELVPRLMRKGREGLKSAPEFPGEDTA